MMIKHILITAAILTGGVVAVASQPKPKEYTAPKPLEVTQPVYTPAPAPVAPKPAPAPAKPPKAYFPPVHFTPIEITPYQSQLYILPQPVCEKVWVSNQYGLQEKTICH